MVERVESWRHAEGLEPHGGRRRVSGRGPRADAQADYAAGQAALRDVAMEATSEIQEIKVVGDWACLWSRLSVVMTPHGGASMTRAGDTLSILCKRDGRWLLFRDANLLAEVT